jgi:hypothetical protein
MGAVGTMGSPSAEHLRRCVLIRVHFCTVGNLGVGVTVAVAAVAVAATHAPPRGSAHGSHGHASQQPLQLRESMATNPTHIRTHETSLTGGQHWRRRAGRKLAGAPSQRTLQGAHTHTNGLPSRTHTRGPLARQPGRPPPTTLPLHHAVGCAQCVPVLPSVGSCLASAAHPVPPPPPHHRPFRVSGVNLRTRQAALARRAPARRSAHRNADEHARWQGWQRAHSGMIPHPPRLWLIALA